ncbi:MAG: DUF488 domain-containing protein [Candidatus Pacebacteria bacterium]|nr:DUF488 domain-containing protein [Candidatus Paceibacterota bacterium]
MKSKKNKTIYTIGHSTRTLDDFSKLLVAHKIQYLVDIRSIPRSLHNPQFNKDTLGKSLKKIGVNYTHIPELGGLRRTSKTSKNLGWHNTSFRGFADYMATEEFEKGLQKLEEIALSKRTACMCAEAVPWRCHRSLIGDALVKRKWTVLDIINFSTATKHRMTPFLRIKKGVLVYPKLPETY